MINAAARGRRTRNADVFFGMVQTSGRHGGIGWKSCVCARKAMQSINSLSQWNLRLWFDGSGAAAVVTRV
jgi:hypothetical protein